MSKPDHVTEKQDGSIEVGPPPDQQARRKINGNATTQQDRIEAKLDLLIAELVED